MPNPDVTTESDLLGELASLRTVLPPHDPQLFPKLYQAAKRFFEQHRYADARPLLEEALQIRRLGLGEDHFQVAESLTHLASLELACRNHTQAAKFLNQAQSILELWPDRKAQHAAVLNQLVETLHADAKYDDAMTFCRKALELQGGNIHAAHADVTRTRNNLAALHVARGEYYLATRLLKLNVQIMQERGPVNDLAVATALNNLAEVFRLQGQLPEAWRQAVKALWLRRRVLGRTHAHVAANWNNLALIRFDQKRLGAAESLFRRVLAIRKLYEATQPAQYAATLRSLAEVSLAAGRTFDAEQMFRQAVEIYERTLGSKDAQVALTLTHLGQLYLEGGQHGSAQQTLARAVEIQQSRRQIRDTSAAFTFNAYGRLHAARGNFEQAEGFHRRALEVQRRMLGKQHPEFAATSILLGDARVARGDFADAEGAYRKALDIRRKQFGESHPGVAEAIQRLAKVMVADNEPQRAKELCGVLRRRHQATLDHAPNLHADVLGTLAEAELALGRFGDVESLTRQELLLREPTRTSRPAESLPAWERLTNLALQQQQLEAALEAVQQVVTLAEKLHGGNHPNMIPFVNRVVTVRLARKEFSEAETAVERVLKLRERKFGAASDELMESLENFGNLFYEHGCSEMSTQYFERASNIRDRNSHALFV